MKSKIPLLIIVAGLIVLGVGVWQIADTKMQTKASLQEAKKLIRERPEKASANQTATRDDSVPLPDMGDTVGILAIPKINAELAIVEGTNPDDLERGVGHYKGSYFPGDKGQIVLSGHRDTVFRHLGELKVGDSLNMQVPYGNFNYEITHTKIVKSDDTSIITLQNKEEELILTTCYPFRYVGNAPKRYIIYAKLKSS
ncbi:MULTISPECIES: class D sortase [Neobacillus]|uniref:Class D sortase n=1 Tax=Neobacillus rhizophilus TaxID=2833579 RepID=A0A942UDT2_9BACI|nr:MULTISPECIES: class D sortase [Neobacillus]MBS4215439.1 class D sortase [Neobacillus rhizophilus]MBU8916666.1 class D sortase [Bacillus sp. FJAT-29953]